MRPRVGMRSKRLGGPGRADGDARAFGARSTRSRSPCWRISPRPVGMARGSGVVRPARQRLGRLGEDAPTATSRSHRSRPSTGFPGGPEGACPRHLGAGSQTRGTDPGHFRPAGRTQRLLGLDGQSIVVRKGVDLYTKPLGAGAEQPLVVDGLSKDPRAWSPDGSGFVYRVTGPGGNSDLWMKPATGDPRRSSPRRLPRTRGVFARWAVARLHLGRVGTVRRLRDGVPIRSGQVARVAEWRIPAEVAGGRPRAVLPVRHEPDDRGSSACDRREL